MQQAPNGGSCRMSALGLAQVLQLDHVARADRRLAVGVAVITARIGNAILIGLSHANLDKLRADGTKGYIRVAGADIASPIDIIITAAPTEAHLLEAMSDMIGPDTKVRIDERLKS